MGNIIVFGNDDCLHLEMKLTADYNWMANICRLEAQDSLLANIISGQIKVIHVPTAKGILLSTTIKLAFYMETFNPLI